MSQIVVEMSDEFELRNFDTKNEQILIKLTKSEQNQSTLSFQEGETSLDSVFKRGAD